MAHTHTHTGLGETRLNLIQVESTIPSCSFAFRNARPERPLLECFDCAGAASELPLHGTGNPDVLI